MIQICVCLHKRNNVTSERSTFNNKILQFGPSQKHSGLDQYTDDKIDRCNKTIKTMNRVSGAPLAKSLNDTLNSLKQSRLVYLF